MGVTLGPLLPCPRINWGSVWVSEGDFGSLDGRFAMIVKSLWVYEGPFSKMTHFLDGFL